MIFKHIYKENEKTIRYKDINFNYITNKEFEDNESALFLGYIKPLNNKSTSKKILEIEGSDNKFDIVNKKPFLHKITHYINVENGIDNNMYVAISKLNFIFILIASFIVLFTAFLLSDAIKNPENNIVQNIYDGLVDEKPVTNNKPDKMLKPGEVRVPGYTNLYIEKGDAIYLNNPKDNTCTFKYIVKLSGKDDIIYESKDIPNGKADMWYPELAAGKYSVDFYIQITKKDGTKGITPYIPNINLEIFE
jgi:hypothetical protein